MELTITPNKSLGEYFRDEMIRLGGEWEKSVINRDINCNKEAIIVREYPSYNYIECYIYRRLSDMTKEQINRVENIAKRGAYFNRENMEEYGVCIGRILVNVGYRSRRLSISVTINYISIHADHVVYERFDNFDDLKEWLEKNNYINFEGYLKK